MPRTKRGFKARRRRNRLMKWARGFRGKRGTCFRPAKETVQHAWLHMYRHRKQRKREFRRLWIVRINAAARQLGVSYSKLMGAMNKANVGIDRKILATLAVSDPNTFKAVATDVGAVQS